MIQITKYLIITFFYFKAQNTLKIFDLLLVYNHNVLCKYISVT